MKRLISVILVIFTLVALMGCANVESALAADNRKFVENLGFTVLEHIGEVSLYDYYVAYDNDTNVIYFVSFTSAGVAISPRYDENGEIMIYGGE